MDDKDCFRIDEPRVISELMDGELVLVHFDSGCYYSVTGVGADVCQLLSAGCTVGQVVDRLTAHYRLPQSRVGSDVRSYVEQLAQEKLLVPVVNASRAEREVALTTANYETPRFEKFDDMADQLLLDPIHDMGESGWPVQSVG
jgi:hypothetical protein